MAKSKPEDVTATPPRCGYCRLGQRPCHRSSSDDHALSGAGCKPLLRRDARGSTAIEEDVEGRERRYSGAWTIAPVLDGPCRELRQDHVMERRENACMSDHGTNRNPQAEQMGDESMARNLAHQANAIWPQEHHLFDRYGLPDAPRILDLGCGTGEITRRLAARYPRAQLTGIDILEGNLAIARRDSAAFGGPHRLRGRRRIRAAPRGCGFRPGGVPAHVAGGAGLSAGAGRDLPRAQARRLAAPAVGGLRHAAHARGSARSGPLLERECGGVPARHRLRRAHRPAFAGAAGSCRLPAGRDGLRRRRYATRSARDLRRHPARMA